MINLKVSRKLAPILTSKHRTITVKGGRGGGKTQSVAEVLVARMLNEKRRDGFYILARETLKNLDTSSREEILAAIKRMGVGKHFKEYVSNGEIKCRLNGNKFVFCGLRNEKDATHIKSFFGVYLIWIDEATMIKKEVMELVTPSIRGADDAQIIITFNPAKKSDYVYQRYVLNADPIDELVITVNYEDNPWFPTVLERERQICKRRAPMSYKRIWRGIAGSAEDIIIDPEWFKFYKVLPRIKYRVIYVDTAMKDKEHNDYTTAFVMGIGFDGMAYGIDMLRGKWKIAEMERRVVAFWNKHNDHSEYDTVTYGQLRLMHVEDAVSGTGLIQNLQAIYRIPVHAVIRTKDKYMRALDVQAYIESGYVGLPAEAPWLHDFLIECEAFNATGDYEHDDQVDVLVDGVHDLLGGDKPFWDYIN